MSQDDQVPAVGESRRARRERERREAAQAEAPMSRRERRALEEALANGLLEKTDDGGYAPTGEIPVTTTGHHVLGLEEIQRTEAARAAEREEAAAQGDDVATEGDAQAAGEQAEGEQAEAAPADDAPAADSPAEAATAEAAPAKQEEAAPADDAPAEAEPAEAAPADDAAPTVPSRRSLRQRRRDVEDQPPLEPGPAQVTETGRRPAIRPPAGAGTRGLDATTGSLTAIQRAVRDMNTPAGGPPSEIIDVSDAASGSAASGSTASNSAKPNADGRGADSASESAEPGEETSKDEGPGSQTAAPIDPNQTATMPPVHVPERISVKDAAKEADSLHGDQGTSQNGANFVPSPAGTVAESNADSEKKYEPGENAASAFSQAAPKPQAKSSKPQTSSGVETADPKAISEADDDDQDLTPNWAKVSSVRPAADEEVGRRRSRKARTSATSGNEPDDESDDERHTPLLLKILYWVVLVLAGIVLGLLVWKMASGDLFGHNGAVLDYVTGAVIRV